MRAPLRHRLTRRLRDASRYGGLALAEVRLRLRWLRWRRQRSSSPTASGEPVRGVRFARGWCRWYRLSRAGTGAASQVSCTIVHGRLPAIHGKLHALDGETLTAVRGISRDRTPGAFVVQLPRARVLGDCGDVVSPDGCWLPDLSLGDRRWAYRSHPFLDRPVPPTLRELEGTALVLAQKWAWGNYFHWMFNCLTRIQLCRLAGIDPAAVQHVIVNANRSAYRRETLERLAMPLDRLLECDEEFHVRADRVLATSSLWFAHMLPWAHDFLRETFLPSADRPGGPERICISRGMTPWRPLVNELDCLALLERHGFVPVRLTGMSVAEQAALFAGAKAVAAPHDAGLTNLVFCPPGTTVIELLSPEHPRAYYSELSAVRGFEHFCLFGELEPDPSAGRAAYRVPVDRLARLVEAAGL
jgi:hypothetical protein